MSGVIELLRAVERQALRVRHTGTPNAAALVAAWPHVAQAADDIERRLPRDGRADDHVIERIALDARSLSTAAGHRMWPGDAEPDPALGRVAAGFADVADHDNLGRWTAADASEARIVVAKVLWTSAQHVGQATRDHSFDLRLGHQQLDPQRALIARLARHTARRFNAVEQLAASATHSADAGDASGQLRESIARWDIEAHRALVEYRSTTVLHILAHHQAVAGDALQAFVHGATQAGVIDGFTGGRLMPVLVDSTRSWEQMRDIAGDFSFASAAVPGSLVDAASDLQARFSYAVRNTEPEDHREVLGALSSHLASAVAIAAAAIDLISAGELRAPARAVNRALKGTGPSPDESVVNPVAIHRGLSIPLPDRARGILAEPAVRVFRDADEAVNRAAGLDALYRTQASTPTTHEASEPARQGTPPPMRRDPGPTPGPAI